MWLQQYARQVFVEQNEKRRLENLLRETQDKLRVTQDKLHQERLYSDDKEEEIKVDIIALGFCGLLLLPLQSSHSHHVYAPPHIGTGDSLGEIQEGSCRSRSNTSSDEYRQGVNLAETDTNCKNVDGIVPTSSNTLGIHSIIRHCC